MMTVLSWQRPIGLGPSTKFCAVVSFVAGRTSSACRGSWPTDTTGVEVQSSADDDDACRACLRVVRGRLSIAVQQERRLASMFARLDDSSRRSCQAHQVDDVELFTATDTWQSPTPPTPVIKYVTADVSPPSRTTTISGYRPTIPAAAVDYATLTAEVADEPRVAVGRTPAVDVAFDGSEVDP